LFDFGVSQITQKPYLASLLTTPEYTTPEMALSFKAYPSTDVFQLGVLFYKLLAGKNPFVRYDLYDFVETEEHRESCIIKFVLPMLFRPLDQTPEVLRENPAIVELLEAMLEKDYLKRPAPEEVSATLEKIQIKGGKL
jgi:serine/threonine protein kinase